MSELVAAGRPEGDHALDRVRFEFSQDLPLGGRVVGGVRQHQGESGVGRSGLDAFAELGEEGIRHRGDEQRDHPASLVDEPPSEQVRAVAELVDGGLDADPGRLRHGRFAVHDA